MSIFVSLCSGEFVVVNKHLLHDLTEMGLWSPVVKNKIIYENGSVQKIPEVPEELKLIYKYVTVFHWIFLHPPQCYALSRAKKFTFSQDSVGDQAEDVG